MPQTILLNNFVNYLELYKKDHLKHLKNKFKLSPELFEKEEKNFVTAVNQLIASFSKGHCFGFSLTYGAMRQIGCIDWWKNVLVFIANLQKEMNLSDEVKITGAIEEKKPDPQSKTLNALFNRVINYIKQSHAVNQPYFPAMTQLNIVQPDGYSAIKPASKKHPSQSESTITRSYFEILDPHTHEIKTIKKRKIIAGNLTKSLLVEDLKSMPEDVIILAHNNIHTIELARQGSDWMVYDPEYDQTQLSTMDKIGSLPDSIDEIYKRLTMYRLAPLSLNKLNSNVIEIKCDADKLNYRVMGLDGLEKYGSISWNKLEENFSNFPKTEKEILANHETLLPVILNHLSQIGYISLNPAIAIDAISFNEKTVIAFPNYNHFFKTSLISLLKNRGLLFLTNYTPHVLPTIFNQIDHSPRGTLIFQTIINELSQIDAENWTTPQIMAHTSPITFIQLLNLLDHSANGQALLKTIIKILPHQNNDGWTLLHTIAKSMLVLCKFIDVIDNLPTKIGFFESFVNSLDKQTSDGWSALHIMAKYCPEGLAKFLKLIDKQPILLKKIIDMLSLGHEKYLPLIHFFARYTPDVLHTLFQQIDSSPYREEFLKKMIEILPLKDEENWTTLHKLARYAPNVLCDLFQRIDDSPIGQDLLQKIIETLPFMINDNLTVLHLIAKVSPKVLVHLFDQINHLEQGNTFFPMLMSLFIVKSNNKTILDTIVTSPDVLKHLLYLVAKNSPETLPQLFDIIDTSAIKEKLLKVMMESIMEPHANGETTLHLIAKAFSTKDIFELLDRKNDSPESDKLFEKIIQALTHVQPDGSTTWQHMNRNDKSISHPFWKSSEMPIKKEIIERLTNRVATNVPIRSATIHL